MAARRIAVLRPPAPSETKTTSSGGGISLPMVTSFTDGTKVQIEQAFVANGLGAEVAKPGLLGVPDDDLRTGGTALAEAAEKLGHPISDYVLSLKLPHGVFIVGKHDPRQKGALRYLKFGDGPYYVVLKHNIFVHLEILRTIKRVVNQGRILLDNSARPVASVCTANTSSTLSVGTASTLPSTPASSSIIRMPIGRQGTTTPGTSG